jgi:hypothetical protein
MKNPFRLFCVASVVAVFSFGMAPASAQQQSPAQSLLDQVVTAMGGRDRL